MKTSQLSALVLALAGTTNCATVKSVPPYNHSMNITSVDLDDPAESVKFALRMGMEWSVAESDPNVYNAVLDMSLDAIAHGGYFATEDTFVKLDLARRLEPWSTLYEVAVKADTNKDYIITDEEAEGLFAGLPDAVHGNINKILDLKRQDDERRKNPARVIPPVETYLIDYSCNRE